MVILILKTVF